MGHENDRYMPGQEFMPGLSAGAQSGGSGSAGAPIPAPPAEDVSGSPFAGMAGHPSTDPAIASYAPSPLLPDGTDVTHTGAGMGSTHDVHPNAQDGGDMG